MNEITVVSVNHLTAQHRFDNMCKNMMKLNQYEMMKITVNILRFLILDDRQCRYVASLGR
jgi:hypothetical protein